MSAVDVDALREDWRGMVLRVEVVVRRVGFVEM